jgi:hypothetical protein
MWVERRASRTKKTPSVLRCLGVLRRDDLHLEVQGQCCVEADRPKD